PMTRAASVTHPLSLHDALPISLCGALADFRKIIVGDRAWRVIWCLTHEDTDEAVYTEMTERVEALRKNPRTVSLAKTIEELGKIDRKSTRLNSSHVSTSYAVFC